MTHSLISALFALVHITGGARAEHAVRPEALLEELHVAHTAHAPEKGEVRMTLALSTDDEEAGLLRDSIDGEFEIEVGLTDRLELSVGSAILDQSFAGIRADDVEIGAAYALVRGPRSSVIAGLERRIDRSGETELRLSHALILRRAEIHSGVIVELQNGERNVAVEAAAIWPWREWRGTLEIITSRDAAPLRSFPAWRGRAAACRPVSASSFRPRTDRSSAS